MPRVNSPALRALCVLGILTTAEGLYAQPTFATLRGTVHDPSGAAIFNATISVRNAATGVLREARSNAEGAWTVFDLLPSRYQITVTSSGFASERAADVELTVNGEQVLDLRLNPATVLGLPRITLIARMQRLGIYGGGVRTRSGRSAPRLADSIEKVSAGLTDDSSASFHILGAAA